MFTHKEHLPQVLAPENYTSQEYFDKEMEAMFRHQWQFVGTLSDLANDGDYLTLELYDQPVIVWRKGDEIYAFLNVCPHRFATLSREKSGNCLGRLKCQYHGWEFDETGNTCKIPDAKSFKPMEKGVLGLTQFHTELVGQLIFVNLSETPNSLKEQLGAGYEIGQNYCPVDRHQYLTLDYEVEANWKVRTEITLESYHIDCIHTSTFSKRPPEETCFHELESNYSCFMSNEPAVKKTDDLLDRLTHRIAKVERDCEYRNYLFYPSITICKMGLFSWTETVFPLAPNRTRILSKFFAQTGDITKLRNKLLLRGLANYGKKFFTTVADEDSAVFTSVQRGMETKSPPSTGLISVREERVFHFQRFVKDRVDAWEKQNSETPSEVTV